jgi:hypothetical protein
VTRHAPNGLAVEQRRVVIEGPTKPLRLVRQRYGQVELRIAILHLNRFEPQASRRAGRRLALHQDKPSPGKRDSCPAHVGEINASTSESNGRSRCSNASSTRSRTPLQRFAKRRIAVQPRPKDQGVEVIAK